MRRVLLLLLVLAALLVSARLFGARRWQGATQASMARLAAANAGPAAPNYDESMLAGLPEPAARYFRNVLRSGAPIRRRARIVQAGQFRMGAAGDSWRPFRATQLFGDRPPAFVWDARIRMAPGLDVHVRDSYLEGEGSMRGEILGLVPVLVAEGGPEMASASLQRWLAEAPWFPTALLPGPGLRWSAVDDSTASVTLTDGPTTVSLQFRFSADGEILSSDTPARAREVKGIYVPTPWQGRYSDYAERGGMRIPLRGEVAWILPEGRFPYWRGEVVGASYD